MRGLFVSLMLVLSGMQVHAQTRQIKGRVTDEEGLALPSVSVTVSGVQRGVTTDASGTFSIPADGRSAVTLVFSISGYKSQTVKADGRSEIVVSLEKEVAALDDVMVRSSARI